MTFYELTSSQIYFSIIIVLFINLFINCVLPSPNLYMKPKDSRYSMNKFYIAMANSSFVSLIVFLILVFTSRKNNQPNLSWSNICVFAVFAGFYIVFAILASEQIGINDNDFRRAVEEHNAIIRRMADVKKHKRNISEKDKQKYQRVYDVNTYNVFENDNQSQSNHQESQMSIPSLPSHQPSLPSHQPSKPSYQPSKPSYQPSPQPSPQPSQQPNIPQQPEINLPSNEGGMSNGGMSNGGMSNGGMSNGGMSNGGMSMEHMTMLFV